MLESRFKWSNVKSGVPQGSVLGPLMFFIYINDTDEGLVNRVLNFADDTKLFRVVASEEDMNMTPSDLKYLCHWSKEWLMLFNVEKCKVMHMGYNNKQNRYEMNGRNVEAVSAECDSKSNCARGLELE
jgi:ribonuclease P/MRP protein subunit RPP40